MAYLTPRLPSLLLSSLVVASSSKAGAAVRGPDGQDVAAFLESVAASKPDAIIVDRTATDATVPALLKAEGGQRQQEAVCRLGVERLSKAR